MQGPYRLPAADVATGGPTGGDLGKSNRHSVQIGHNSRSPEFRSMTMQQQAGSRSGAASADPTKDAQELREGTARLKADLRSSHFALGTSKELGQSSSAVQYRAPPYTALISNGDTALAGERMRRGNFNLADGTKTNSTETAGQAQNKALSRQWEKGEIAKSAPLAKPVTTVGFGQGCQYTSEAKATFIPQTRVGSLHEDKNRFKDKFTKGSILLEAAGNKNDMQTVAMKEAQNFANPVTGSLNQGPGGAHNAKEFALQMRAANFKTGSHLPETNQWAAPRLDKGGSSAALGQVPKRVDFRQNAKAMLPSMHAQGVSAGNNISRGKGDFQTVNQSYVRWIQPKATA